MRSLALDASSLQNPEELLSREWLETNGLGGFASSSVAGAHTRRYHGLLVAAIHPPTERVVLLSKLDETLVFGGERYELGSACFPGAMHPQGHRYLTAFSRGTFPTWEYECGGIALRKTIGMLHGENSCVILYQVLSAPALFALELLPLVAARGYHELAHANSYMAREAIFRGGALQIRSYEGLPPISVFVPQSTFESRPDWYYNFEYGVEKSRGFDCHEDLFTPGVLRVTVTPGSTVGVIVSTENATGRDAVKLLEGESRRRDGLLAPLKKRDELVEILTAAADQFIVSRDQSGRTVIAGYPWFTDWGRDSLIALPGLCLVTGRFEDAKKILSTFAAHVSQGMVPNLFPDGATPPEYNTVDASLWFFIAVFRYLKATGDVKFVRSELVPVLLDILAHHEKGTRYGIHADTDALLSAGDAHTQLTWMDARSNGVPVTPRFGKAVEINALWYNAYATLAAICAEVGIREGISVLNERAAKIHGSFSNLFWNPELGCLYDCVRDGYSDPAVRPNQIFALSLPFPLLAQDRAAKVLKVVSEQLYTPYGLRSLAPGDPQYIPIYRGSGFERDRAYHQGTVWSWLLGPYITALVRFGGDEGLERSKALINRFKLHLLQGCIGNVSEVFDGAPPHEPGGSPAQAWGVAEVLRAYVEDIQK